MKIKLNRPFAANTAVDEFDVKQIKKALNRVGYYKPPKEAGITGIPDRAVFDGLKSFQADQGLPATGTLKDGDETTAVLEKLGGEKTGKYIWRTVGDSRVRKSHSALEGTIRDFEDDPDPGEEINCRCWAEPVNCDEEYMIQHVTSDINDDEKQWQWWDYLIHFWTGGGEGVALPSIGWLGSIIEECKNQVFPNVEDQVAALARQIEQGAINYETENSYEFGNISFAIGGATVSTETIGTVSISGKCLIIEAEVSYKFSDDFTDITSFRQKIKDWEKDLPDEVPQWFRQRLKSFERGGITDFGGSPYLITGGWETKMTGIIKRIVQD